MHHFDQPSQMTLLNDLTRPAPDSGAIARTAASDSLWFKDAIIYQLHVKAFFDADNDGIGDFEGLRHKLDYLQDLGVTTLWLLPFYPSQLRDFYVWSDTDQKFSETRIILVDTEKSN